ncbi:copper transporter [Rhodococcus erythropolis]|uniref:copper transporter n=1 Tax=Rhodococcus erythropolis TaxID=1833 RepID=UPI001E545F61|nr:MULTISPECIES: copper transporter [Rhodococcus erythropolis group]MCD2109369.1 copper transporter [Rhodococcus qingshengii]MCZ4528294.1 copper transporter [Rhodococcus erythropolis]
MISMRQHAISIAAIFLALAIGVVLGSGMLSSGLLSGLRDDKADLQNEIEDLNQQSNQLQQQLNSADGFDAAVGGRVVRDSLAGRTVIVITAPDADPSDLDGVNRLVTAAGGAVTGRVSLTDSFVDATGGDRLRTVVTNVIPAGITLKTGAVDQGSLAGDLLGSVLLLNGQSSEPQSTTDEMNLALDSLRSAGFISYDDGAVKPAQLAVVLTGDNKSESDAASGNRGAVIARFAGALDGRGAGTILAGRPGSAEGSGPVAVARADAALSAGLTTIDNIDRESGKITTPLALQEQLNGGAGRYGTGPGAAAVTVGAPTN